MKQQALTITGDGILRILVSEVAISEPFLGHEEKIKNKVIKGIWDTGASNSAINKTVVQELGLKPVSMTQVHTAKGTVNSNVYLVNITLPMNVVIQGVRVTEAELTGADMLIGMDVISFGDFSITNYNGKTKMTFRMPSCHEIDYVREINQSNEQGRLAKYLPIAGKRKAKRKKTKRK